MTVVALCAVFLLSVNVAAANSKKIFDCSGKIQKAVDKFNKKQYGAVEDILTIVLAECPGFSAYDTALFYQAKSFLLTKKFEEAKGEFEKLVQSYSSSPFYEESNYRLAQCMYLSSNPVELDQASTKEAQVRLKDFSELYPSSMFADSAKALLAAADDKLAEKEFLAARFYEKVDQFEAAIVYFKLMAQEFPQSKFVAPALLSMSQDLIKTNRLGEAAVVLNDLLVETKDSEILKKASALKATLNKSAQQ